MHARTHLNLHMPTQGKCCDFLSKVQWPKGEYASGGPSIHWDAIDSGTSLSDANGIGGEGSSDGPSKSPYYLETIFGNCRNPSVGGCCCDQPQEQEEYCRQQADWR